MDALYKLVVNSQWQVAIANIQSLADGNEVYQIFYQNEYMPSCSPVPARRHWNSCRW